MEISWPRPHTLQNIEWPVKNADIIIMIDEGFTYNLFSCVREMCYDEDKKEIDWSLNYLEQLYDV